MKSEINVGPRPKDGKPKPCIICGAKIHLPLTWDYGQTNHWICVMCAKNNKHGGKG